LRYMRCPPTLRCSTNLTHRQPLRTSRATTDTQAGTDITVRQASANLWRVNRSIDRLSETSRLAFSSACIPASRTIPSAMESTSSFGTAIASLPATSSSTVDAATSGTRPRLIASAAIPTAALGGDRTDFVIDLKAHLPQFNTGTVAQDYLVKVSSKLANGDTTLQWSTTGTLTQLPQADEPVPAMVDPYTCAPGKYPRDIQIEIPQMTVNSTSSTPGDGDRDEVYMAISRIGPGTDTRQKRLPYIDLAYEAKNGQTVFENAWTDEDEKHRTNPMLWAGILEHGQTVTLAVKIGEEDDGTLADVRKGLQTALDAIADVAATVPGYGTVVAAVAKAGSAAAGLMPQNSSDDVIGFTTVQLWNKCGNIQSAWVTFHKKSFGEAGSISNDFLDVDTQQAFEARTVVLNSAAPGFYTEYAPFSWAGTDDEFFWIAKGTHGSAYTFLVQQHVKAG